jgi:SAM-dependent methyltransferase
VERDSSVAAYYDEFWSAEEEPRYTPGSELWALIFDGVTPETRCLDVGCGTGNSYAGELRKRGVPYVGVDISSEAVRAAPPSFHLMTRALTWCCASRSSSTCLHHIAP